MASYKTQILHQATIWRIDYGVVYEPSYSKAYLARKKFSTLPFIGQKELFQINFESLKSNSWCLIR